MALYDSPAAHFDTGLRYDEAVATTHQKRMAKVALNLRNLTEAQRLAKLKQAHDAVLDNAATFPTPNPPLASVLSAHDAADAKLLQIINTEQQLDMLRSERDTLMATAMQAYANLGSFVENKAMGDAAKIQLGGYDVAGVAGPAQPMPKVESLALTSGDDDGTADAVWASVSGAKSYEVQVSVDPITGNSWQHFGTVTKSKITLTGQPSGQKRWIRVRAINSVGPGAWSDPACCTIP